MDQTTITPVIERAADEAAKRATDRFACAIQKYVANEKKRGTVGYIGMVGAAEGMGAALALIFGSQCAAAGLPMNREAFDELITVLRNRAFHALSFVESVSEPNEPEPDDIA